VINEVALERYLQFSASVQHLSGTRVLLAQKAFFTFTTAPVVGRYLSATCSDGHYETRFLGKVMGDYNFEQLPNCESYARSTTKILKADYLS